MKLSRFIKDLYFSNPESFGFDCKKGFSEDSVWFSVIKQNITEFKFEYETDKKDIPRDEEYKEKIYKFFKEYTDYWYISLK